MASRIPSALIASLLISVVLSNASSAGAAKDATAEASELQDARRLYKEGKDLYGRGDYEGAIDRFRRAYDAWPDPLVIFAVAQAQRKNGDCAAALESYGRFMKVAEPSAVREEAEDRVTELERTCPARAPTSTPSAPVELGPVTADVAPEAQQPSSEIPPADGPPSLVSRPRNEAAAPRTSARVALAMTVGGLLLGGTGGGTFLWNSSRFDRWRSEDTWLGSGAGGTSAAEFTRRQQVNDELSRSIHRYDQVSLGLVVAAGLSLATAAFIYFVGREPR